MVQVNEYFYDQEMPREYMSENSAQQLIKDPKLFTMVAVAPQPSKPNPAEKPPANKPLVMRVSICCYSCADVIDHDIKKVKGVKDVDCDVFRHKVTVTGGAAVADVLTAARRHFKDAELWD